MSGHCFYAFVEYNGRWVVVKDDALSTLFYDVER